MKVRINADVIFEETISADVVDDEWYRKTISLDDYAGQIVRLQVENHSEDELTYINLAKTIVR